MMSTNGNLPTDVQLEAQQPVSNESRPLPRLWNRGDAGRITVLFLVFYLATQIAIGVIAFGVDLSGFAVTVASLLASVAAGVGVVLGVNRFRPKHTFKKLGFTPITRQWLINGTVLAAIAGLIRFALLSWLAETFPALNIGVEALSEMLSFEGTSQMVIILVLTAILVPLWEELFFRGFLHNVLRNRMGMWGAILLSSLLFGAFHIIPLQAIGAFLLGIVIAWAYEKSGSLSVAIFIHALNNAVFVLLTFLMM